MRTLSLSDCRYSAIRCASAVPMSSVELQQARDVSRAPAPEPEQKKTVLNGDAKPPAKPQKGIMGMFGNKAASKAVDSSKDVKSEPKEEEVLKCKVFLNQRPSDHKLAAPTSRSPLPHSSAPVYFECFRLILKKANQRQRAIPWPTSLEPKPVRRRNYIFPSAHSCQCV